MNEFDSNMLNFPMLAAIAGIVAVALIAWYFVNRASVKAGAQIALLEAILEQQKRQNALLRRVCDGLPLAEERHTTLSDDKTDDGEDDGLIRLVAER